MGHPNTETRRILPTGRQAQKTLAEKIPGAIYCSTLDKVADTLASLARPGDLILTVGAGDIFRAGEKLLERA